MLGPLTTFRIGGPAHFFVAVHTLEELKEALAFASERSVPILFLGGGSNILIADEGFEGLVIKIELRGIELHKEETGSLLIASAGESWDGVVAYSVSEHLWGLENLSGIPGTVGAAPVQNIGAYGSEVKDTIRWVEALDVRTGEIKRFDTVACQFAYRSSFFKRDLGRWCVIRVAFGLVTHGTPNVQYRDLAEAFNDRPMPTLADIRRVVLAIRARKFPDLTKEGTAGSFFLNPVVPVARANQLKSQFPALPQYAADGGIKISLAWLLDAALGLKGFSVGGARLFEKQPLVVVAAPGSSSREVESLSREVIEKIRATYAIDVEPEVRIVHTRI